MNGAFARAGCGTFARSERTINPGVFIAAILLPVLLVLSSCGNLSEQEVMAPVQSVEPESSSEVSSQPPQYDTTPVKIQMAGDVLLHTMAYNGAKTGKNTYNFKDTFTELKPYLNGDLIICNMETPVDAKGGNSGISPYPYFNAPREILDALKYAGFNTLVNANNHAFDKGWDGLVNTRKNILSAGFGLIGTYENKEQHDTYYIREYNGIKIGVLAYSDGDNGVYMAKDKREFCMKMFDSYSTKDVPRMVSDIQKCKEAGAEYIIMSLHWGDEYNDKPDVGPRKQQEIAKLLIDGGADIIMGNHAHTVQPLELKKVNTDGRERTGIISYALGNLFADQYGLKDSRVGNTKKTYDSMVLTAEIARNADTGEIELKSSNYMPITLYKYKSSPNKYKIAPLGVISQKRPDYCKSDSDFKHFKYAYDRVKKAVGNTITLYDGK